MNPYCFVITSYGQKPDLKDMQTKLDSKSLSAPVQKIDFDTIYKELVEPAIRAAGMEPLIEYQEASFGSIHKTMYEKIILCEFCVADITDANPNAYYELGMRYAVGPTGNAGVISVMLGQHFLLHFFAQYAALSIFPAFEKSDHKMSHVRCCTVDIRCRVSLKPYKIQGLIACIF